MDQITFSYSTKKIQPLFWFEWIFEPNSVTIQVAVPSPPTAARAKYRQLGYNRLGPDYCCLLELESSNYRIIRFAYCLQSFHQRWTCQWFYIWKIQAHNSLVFWYSRFGVSDPTFLTYMSAAQCRATYAANMNKNSLPNEFTSLPQNALFADFFTLCPDPPILCPDPPILCPAFYVSTDDVLIK